MHDPGLDFGQENNIYIFLLQRVTDKISVSTDNIV